MILELHQEQILERKQEQILEREMRRQFYLHAGRSLAADIRPLDFPHMSLSVGLSHRRLALNVPTDPGHHDLCQSQSSAGVAV